MDTLPPSVTGQASSLKADTSWFHVFSAMVRDGDCKVIGAFAVVVYLVVKAHTNFKTGYAFPEITTIVEKSGISRRQVIKSLKVLEDHGYLSREKKGRRNLYRLREKIEIRDQAGRPAAVATWNYLPSAVEEARAQLKRLLIDGRLDCNGLGRSGLIFIEQLSLNLQIVHGGEGTQVNNCGGDSIPPRRH